MAVAQEPKRLGKHRKVGETFCTTTKRMIRKLAIHHGSPYLKVLQPGHTQFFTKGKRRYYCMVIGITETRTGYCCWDTGDHIKIIEGVPPKNWHGWRRWWQFTYLVKILEN